MEKVIITLIVHKGFYKVARVGEHRIKKDIISQNQEVYCIPFSN